MVLHGNQNEFFFSLITLHWGEGIKSSFDNKNNLQTSFLNLNIGLRISKCENNRAFLCAQYNVQFFGHFAVIV